MLKEKLQLHTAASTQLNSTHIHTVLCSGVTILFKYCQALLSSSHHSGNITITKNIDSYYEQQYVPKRNKKNYNKYLYRYAA